MLINIEALDGATLEHEGRFYTASLSDNRLSIGETFTGVSAASSEEEHEILKAMIEQLEKDTKEGAL